MLKTYGDYCCCCELVIFAIVVNAVYECCGKQSGSAKNWDKWKWSWQKMTDQEQSI